MDIEIGKKYDTAGNEIKDSFNKRGHRCGKTSLAINEFFERGKQGEAVIYATLEGNFLSPEMGERLKKEERKRVIEELRELLRSRYPDDFDNEEEYKAWSEGVNTSILCIKNWS